MRLIGFLGGIVAAFRDPYRNRLDNMSVEEVTRLSDQGKLTIREVERLHRLALESRRVNEVFAND